MFPVIFLVLLLLYLSVQTNPPLEKLRTLLSSLGKSRTAEGDADGAASSTAATASVGRFLRRLASVGTPAPDIVVENYRACSVATVRYADGSEATYLGWLGHWWLLSEILLRGSAVSSTATRGEQDDAALDEAESLKEAALGKKRARKFAEAAQAYVKASNAFRAAATVKGGIEDLAAYEAASCLEEAAKCRGQVSGGDRLDDEVIEWLEQAVELFTHRGTTGESRAAGILCKLAAATASSVPRDEERNGPSSTGLRAAQLYRRAADLYERAGDGRHCYTRIHEAETAARFGHYLHAVHAFDAAIDVMQHSPTDLLLIPQHFLNGGLCWAAVGAWGRLDGHLAKSIELLPSFETSAQGKFLQTLYDCAINSDKQLFSQTCESFMQRHRLEPWQQRALAQSSAAFPDAESLR